MNIINKSRNTKIFIFLVLFFTQLILVPILLSNDIINSYVVNKIIFPLEIEIGKFTNSYRFPIGEIVYFFIMFLIFRLIYILIRYYIKKDNIRKREITLKILVFINYLYFIYMFAWGVMYKKDTLTFDVRTQDIDYNRLKEIYCSELEKAIAYRNTIEYKGDETLQFSSKLQDYNQDFEQLQYNLKNLNWLKNYHFLAHPVYKFSNISMLQNYLGILGYYNPFTIESNLNSYNSCIKQPFTLFHEYAHQMGFARESEANFIAYYLGSLSKNHEVNYAIHYECVYSLLDAISKCDPHFVKNEINNMNKNIKRDREAEKKFYYKYNGSSRKVFSELNNLFLKANNQEGTINYGKYIELIYKLYT